MPARAAQAEWSQWPLRKRLAVFKRAHTLLVDNADTTTDLIQAESGKNRRMAMEETCDPPMVMSHYLKRAPRLLAPTRRGGPVPFVSSSTEIRQPKGVVGIIAPWNFPFATGISDAIPALMAGNGDRPQAGQQDRALAAVRRVPARAGRPAEGALPGRLRRGIRRRSDPDRQRQLRDVHRLDGDRPGDRRARRAQPDRLLPRARRQEPDDRARRRGRRRRGDRCPVRRVRQHRPDLHAHRADLPARLAATTSSGRSSSPPPRGCASGRRTTSSRSWARWSRSTTATASQSTWRTPWRRARRWSPAAGHGPTSDPRFYEPTVLEDVTKDMLAGSCETFGPVVALHRYRTVDEAVALANDTDYGLNASVWGTDLDRAAAVGTADPVRQRQRQRRPRRGVRLEGDPVRRGQAVRRRRAARRPGPAEVHRRAEPRRPEEAGAGPQARPGLRGVRQADADRSQGDAPDAAPLTSPFGTKRRGSSPICRLSPIVGCQATWNERFDRPMK